MATNDVAPEFLRSLRRGLNRSAPNLRRALPWIGDEDPWAIVVSEFMLQQTQTSRVVEPWRRFMVQFPTPRACARAPLADVLRAWEGLGFHRRAKYLHQTAQVLVEQFGGEVPSDVTVLRRLPGVGPYTASAIASFAFGAGVAVVDTNVGRVLARYVANRPLDPKTAQGFANRVVPAQESARFNQALLDLGAQFCTRTPSCESCPVRRGCRWRREGGPDPAPGSAGVSKPQSTFAGSDRQVRGRVLARLRIGSATESEMASLLGNEDSHRAKRILATLVTEGLVSRRRGRWVLGGAPTGKVPT